MKILNFIPKDKCFCYFDYLFNYYVPLTPVCVFLFEQMRHNCVLWMKLYTLMNHCDEKKSCNRHVVALILLSIFMQKKMRRLQSSRKRHLINLTPHQKLNFFCIKLSNENKNDRMWATRDLVLDVIRIECQGGRTWENHIINFVRTPCAFTLKYSYLNMRKSFSRFLLFLVI